MIPRKQPQPEPEPDEEEDESLESVRIRAWRRRCLLQMGMSRPYARLIADSDADLHRVLALLRHGATADQVRRIVM